MSEIPEAPKDKRTKEFKAWKAKYDAAPEGLGDVVEKVTKATGIKKAVKAVFGDDCGCDERKAKMNQIIRFKPKDCFTEDEFQYLSQFYSEEQGMFNEKATITPEQQKELIKIHNRVSPRQVTVGTNCAPCFLNSVYRTLSKMYTQYL